MMASFAKFENQKRAQRQQIGIQKAKAAGKYIGRKPKIHDDKTKQRIHELLFKQKLTVSEVAKCTLYNYLNTIRTITFEDPILKN
jgi:DNA invertase Pin-like site-specific DNA recombinase